MSGIFIGGSFKQNTDKICIRCKSPAWETDTPGGYLYQCLKCDEDLFGCEVEEQDPHYLPRVIVGRHVNGITLNADVEYLLDDEGKERIFENQPTAEAFLLSNGLEAEDLEFMYFVEIDHEEATKDEV